MTGERSRVQNAFPVRIAGRLALLLAGVAWLRSAEYDEHMLFLTGGVARPIWGSDVITAGNVQALQSGRAGFFTIARDLRATDVHPPLYFWTIAEWRGLMGNSLVAARLASVLFSVVTLGLIAAIARSVGISTVAAMLLTVGCYGFAYTGAIARAFAMAQMLSVAGVAVLIIARRRPWSSFAAGTLLGAATFTYYLAAFVACAALLHTVVARGAAARQSPHLDGYCRVAAFLAMTVGFVVWLPGDLWFFLAQRQNRVGQLALFRCGPCAGKARAVFSGQPVRWIAALSQWCSDLPPAQWRWLASVGQPRRTDLYAAGTALQRPRRACCLS